MPIADDHRKSNTEAKLWKLCPFWQSSAPHTSSSNSSTQYLHSHNHQGNPSSNHQNQQPDGLNSKATPTVSSVARSIFPARRRLRLDPPHHLHFPYEPGKQVRSAVRIKNSSKSHVAFKFQTTAPKSCYMRPPGDILAPGESLVATVYKFVEQPENNEKLLDQKTKVKFKIMSLKVKEGTEYVPELFDEQRDHVTIERVMRAVFSDPGRQNPAMEKLKRQLAEADAAVEARKKPPADNGPKVGGEGPAVVHISLFGSFCLAGDAFVYYDFEVAYITASPLGVPQQVIAINQQFPGPPINVTTNNNVVVNVHNKLDENLLMTWAGVQQRKSSWQDGVLGTNCPIPPKWNWTYQFQVKDQVGSFFYFPSINFQRASGGYGGLIINNRPVIPIPFAEPDGDIIVLIGDWYTRNHSDLRKSLNGGKDLGKPDGVLINGKGPYRYNDTIVPDGIDYETINVHPGKTYRFRVHNVGISTSLNFRIQEHNMLLAESEGSYTVQQNYTSLDIHVGQSYSFLVTMDQNASSDYYIVASARFVNQTTWQRVTGVGILRYSNSKGKAHGPLPDPPQDEFDKTMSMNQARSIRWNVTASGARPNPQGSFRYGDINVTEVYVIQNLPHQKIDGKKRATINGVSFVNPSTPIKLADEYKVKNVYKLDFPHRPKSGSPRMETSVINGTYRGFFELIFQNNDTKVQTYHLDGYAFFVVGMDYGVWSEGSRGTYNKWDGVARTTAQVYPGAWTAVLVSLDNVGVWNLRTENLDSWYLGQETYIRVVNPETNTTELPKPDNALYCGSLRKLQKPEDISFARPIAAAPLQLFFSLFMACASFFMFH